MNFFTIEYAQKFNNFNLSVYTYVYEDIKKDTYMCECVRELIWTEIDGTCSVKSMSIINLYLITTYYISSL